MFKCQHSMETHNVLQGGVCQRYVKFDVAKLLVVMIQMCSNNTANDAKWFYWLQYNLHTYGENVNLLIAFLTFIYRRKPETFSMRKTRHPLSSHNSSNGWTVTMTLSYIWYYWTLQASFQSKWWHISCVQTSVERKILLQAASKQAVNWHETLKWTCTKKDDKHKCKKAWVYQQLISVSDIACWWYNKKFLVVALMGQCTHFHISILPQHIIISHARTHIPDPAEDQPVENGRHYRSHVYSLNKRPLS